jgi:hypothetical protein
MLFHKKDGDILIIIQLTNEGKTNEDKAKQVRISH